MLDEEGGVIWRGSCKSTPEVIAATVSQHAAKVVRLGLETGTLSPWLTRGLAEIVRSSWYRRVQVKSQSAYQLQALVGARAHLVKVKTDLTNQIRGLLRTFGLVVGKAGGKKFDLRVQELIVDDEALQPPIEALLSSWRQVYEQIGVLDKRLLAVARQSVTIQRLMTVPSIGKVTAAAYASAIDDPSRFAKSASVGAYVGLTPRRHQTGELDYAGRISKRGNKVVRSYLYEAAGILLNRVHRPSWL